MKAIQKANGNIQVQDDFEIEPEDVITVQQFNDLRVIPSNQGSVQAVKITDERKQTVELAFSQISGIVKQDLPSKAYLLDVIVLMENGDKYAYETVLVVLAPGQTLNQVNTQNIIQNFVTSTE